jgi:hypothetical protein
LSYSYNFINIADIDCNLLLKQNSPKAWILAILCDFKDKNPKDIISFIIDRLIEYTKEDVYSYKKYMLMLETLSTNRDLKDKIKEIEMLRTTSYQDLPSWEIGLEQGYKRGLERGLEKGLEQGLEQGLQRGLEQGILKGRLEGIYFFEKDPYKIANMLNVDIEFVKQVISKLKS